MFSGGVVIDRDVGSSPQTAWVVCRGGPSTSKSLIFENPVKKRKQKHRKKHELVRHRLMMTDRDEIVTIRLSSRR